MYTYIICNGFHLQFQGVFNSTFNFSFLCFIKHPYRSFGIVCQFNIFQIPGRLSCALLLELRTYSLNLGRQHVGVCLLQEQHQETGTLAVPAIMKTVCQQVNLPQTRIPSSLAKLQLKGDIPKHCILTFTIKCTMYKSKIVGLGRRTNTYAIQKCS